MKSKSLHETWISINIHFRIFIKGNVGLRGLKGDRGIGGERGIDGLVGEVGYPGIKGDSGKYHILRLSKTRVQSIIQV